MTRAFLIVAVILAVALAHARRSPRQTQVAGALAALLALDALRAVSATFRAAPPYEGLARAAWAVDGAALCAWYAVTALAVWSVLILPEEATSGMAQAGAALVIYVFALSSLLFLFYAAIRGATFVRLVAATFTLALASQLLAAARFLSHGRWPDDAQRVALILTASSLVDALPGPWLLGMPARDWAVGRWIAAVTWIAVAAWEARCLIRAHRSRE